MCRRTCLGALCHVWVESISMYHSHAPVFGLVLSLASAESPVWGYLTADCREHRVFYPRCPMSLLVVDIEFVLPHRLYQAENLSAI